MPSNDEIALLGSEIHYLTSTGSGLEYKIHVRWIGSRKGEKPIVLYHPDANGTFGGVVSSLRLPQLYGSIPPVLVIGIGYRIQREHEMYQLRARDLTPFQGDPTFAAKNWESGRADEFLDFIRDDLKPWVALQYGVDPDDDVFFGYSLGGLFGTYVLLTQPETFKRYGLGSPSLWFQGHAIFKLEADRASSRDDLAAEVFFSTGELETPRGAHCLEATLPEGKREAAKAAREAEIAMVGEIDMVQDMVTMVERLRERNYPSLKMGSEVLSDESHYTATLRCLSKSMRFLFDARG
jgi:predicted alpha/beta superfamily hydrolase